MNDAALMTDVTVGFPAESRPELWFASSPALPSDDTRLCVLLVEDDEADAYFVKRALARNPRIGELVVARDGVEALELIDLWAMEPDLAIVDLHLPRRDGFGLLHDFAERDDVKFASVVLTSSKAGADVLRAKKRGAFAYLVKPNTAAELTAALNEVIAKI